MSLLRFLRSSAPAPPGPEHVRAQLADILGTRSFRATPLERKFLSYAVERALEGVSDLEEGIVARAVFGRDEAFEASTDNVVRLTARRVRKRLDRYYAQRPEAQVRIKLRKGSFLPVFSTSEASGERRRAILARLGAAFAAVVILAGALWLAGGAFLRWRADHAPHRKYRSIAVAPLRNATGIRRLDGFMDLLGNELSSRLERYPDLRVVSRPETAKASAANSSAAAIAQALSVETVLRGKAEVANRRFLVKLELVEGSGKIVWSEVYDAPEHQQLAMLGDVAYAVATAMGATGK